jgi:hypothetical protein
LGKRNILNLRINFHIIIAHTERNGCIKNSILSLLFMWTYVCPPFVVDQNGA